MLGPVLTSMGESCLAAPTAPTSSSAGPPAPSTTAGTEWFAARKVGARESLL